jgi:hypothetical protein
MVVNDHLRGLAFIKIPFIMSPILKQGDEIKYENIHIDTKRNFSASSGVGWPACLHDFLAGKAGGNG